MARVLRDAGAGRLVAASSDWQVVATGLEFSEGPLWLPAEDALLFQDLKTERTYRASVAGTVEVLRESTGAANGQTFGPTGEIVFCEQNGRRVSRMNRDGGGVTTLVEEFDGQRLNSPNDIVARSDGTLVFTDPAYGAPPDRPLEFQGVYALGPDGVLTLLADDFEKPNGLAFAPDERTLYVCDTGRYHVRALEIAADGQGIEGIGRVVCELDPEEPGGPDGMKVDRSGRLYIAVAQGIWVVAPEGGLLGILATPGRPSNLAWCGPDADVLAVTMGNTVLRMRLETQGVPPVFQGP
jgi:gluconolactonase